MQILTPFCHSLIRSLPQTGSLVSNWTSGLLETSLIGCTHSPGHLHGVLGEIDDPVDQVEGAEGKREEDARVLVDDAGAGQDVVGRHGRALLEEGLGVDGRVGEGLCRPIKQRCRIYSFFEHAAGIHLQEAERTNRIHKMGHVVGASSVPLLALAHVAFSNSCPVITHSSGQGRNINHLKVDPFQNIYSMGLIVF